MLPEQSPWPHPVTNDHWRNINPVQHIQPFPILHNLLPEISLQLQPWPNALSHDYLQRQYPAQQLTEKNYTILNTILGRGTSSTVYLGVHLQTGTTVAIKELHSSLSQPEIDCLLSVQHDNIIRLLDFWMKNGMSYLVLEKCGCDLRQ